MQVSHRTRVNRTPEQQRKQSTHAHQLLVGSSAEDRAAAAVSRHWRKPGSFFHGGGTTKRFVVGWSWRWRTDQNKQTKSMSVRRICLNYFLETINLNFGTSNSNINIVLFLYTANDSTYFLSLTLNPIFPQSSNTLRHPTTQPHHQFFLLCLFVALTISTIIMMMNSKACVPILRRCCGSGSACYSSLSFSTSSSLYLPAVLSRGGAAALATTTTTTTTTGTDTISDHALRLRPSCSQQGPRRTSYCCDSRRWYRRHSTLDNVHGAHGKERREKWPALDRKLPRVTNSAVVAVRRRYYATTTSGGNASSGQGGGHDDNHKYSDNSDSSSSNASAHQHSESSVAPSPAGMDAVEAAESVAPTLTIPGAQTGGRKLAIVYTCNVCQTRSAKQFTAQAYYHGVVLIRCPKCQNLHLIADRLGYFADDEHGKEWDMERLAASRGESLTRVTDNDVGVLELTPEDLLGREKLNELLERHAVVANDGEDNNTESSSAAGDEPPTPPPPSVR